MEINKEDLQVNFYPTEDDLEKVLDWLKNEPSYIYYFRGFYNQRQNIIDAFEDKRFIIIQNGKSKQSLTPIGFLTFKKTEKCAEIVIMNIHHDFKGKGIGTKLYKEVEKSFKEQGIKVIRLECSPPESEGFWKRVGFDKEIPKKFKVSNHKELFTLLTPVMEPTNNSRLSNKIELWEPYSDPDKDAPNKIWELEKDPDILEKPIIEHVTVDWLLRITLDDEFYQQGYISEIIKNHQMNFCARFLIIEEII